MELFDVLLMSVFFDRTGSGLLLTCCGNEERKKNRFGPLRGGSVSTRIIILPYRSTLLCPDQGLVGLPNEHVGSSMGLDCGEVGFNTPGSAVQVAVGVFDVHIPAYLAFNLLID